jgi:hypothetical protein
MTKIKFILLCAYCKEIMENLTKHIERMMKPYREIEKIIEPIRKMQKQLSDSTLAIQKTVEPTLELQKRLEQSFLNFQESFEHINKIYSSIPKFENPILEHLDTFKEIGERLKEYTEKTPEYFLLIAQRGWFIDLESELNFPARVAYEIQEGELETANELLVEYYNEKNNKYLPEVTSELEKSAETFLDLYLSPLQNQTPIMVREQDVSKFPCHLNRHEILHGISTDYGTEINSLKVISLLKYISDLITDLDVKTLIKITEYKQ